MARVIEFYVSTSFRKKVKWVQPGDRGKVVRFPTTLKKPA